jgi:hypothetical protein
MRQEEINGIQIVKTAKISLFADDMILYLKDSNSTVTLASSWLISILNYLSLCSAFFSF